MISFRKAMGHLNNDIPFNDTQFTLTTSDFEGMS